MSTDAELLRGYAHDARIDALETLVRRHAAWLKGCLIGLMGESSQTDDAFQEVWLRVMKNARGYKGGSFRAYLARVARCVVIDQARRMNARPHLSLDELMEESEGAYELKDDALVAAEQVEWNQSKEAVWQAFRQLPFPQREVVMLRVKGEMSFKEIAAELRRPLGTILAQMKRATARLKQLLEDKE